MVQVGAYVKNFSVGQTVGVGCTVDSCQSCANYAKGLEQYCEVGFTGTYNSPDKHTGSITYGGYSDKIVVDKNSFCIFRTSSTLPRQRGCCVPASLRIRRCGTKMSARAKKSVSSASVVPVTWV